MERTLRICFTSDLHAFLCPTDYRGEGEKDLGLFKCANRFGKDGNTLVIDGGDLLQGSPFGAYCHDTLDDPGCFARVMDRCGYDYVTLGNHDFNYGMGYLGRYLDGLKARCVCQNLLEADGSVSFPARIHRLENGLRVGVVGLVTDHVMVWERPEHLEGRRVADPIPAARAALAELRGKVDLTVCVYHGGFERDLETGRVLSDSTENVGYRICQELDFDLLLTGHQHLCIPGRELFGTYTVQAPDSGRAFLELAVTVGEGGIRCASRAVPAGGPCDPALLRDFAPIEEGVQGWLDVEVGRLERPLLPDAPLAMAAGGSGLADLFNRVQLEASGAELSVSSLANDAAGLPRVVRRRDVLTAYPYTNTLVVLRVTGQVLRRAVERAAEYFALDEAGELRVSEGFLKPKVEHYNYDYFAGVEYVIDPARPEGQRVVSLTRDGAPVAEEQEFTLCLSSYRASGAGGYPWYLGCPRVREINMEMTDLILEFFGRHPRGAALTKAGLRVLGWPPGKAE